MVVRPHSLAQQIFAEGHFRWRVLTMWCGHKWSRRLAPALDLRAVTVPESLPAPGRASPAHGWASVGHVTQAVFRGQDHENLQMQ